MRLSCNECKQNKNGYCLKLKETLPNGYAKLHFGGIINDPNHAGKCKVISA